MERKAFRAIVRKALAELPMEFREGIHNLAIVVQSRPTAREKRSAGLGPGQTLLGLYQGVPLPQRAGYNLVPPDKITLYQEPLEAIAEDDEELKAEIRKTLLHELAHYFGIDDEQLRRLQRD